MNLPQSFDAYGVSERLAATDEIDEAIAELTVNGYTTLASGFSTEYLSSLRQKLDHIYAQQVAEFGSESALMAINDADIARCMLSYDAEFINVASAPTLMALSQRFLGPEFVLLMQNGILNRPDRENYQAKWHRDLNYQHWTSSRPLAINALLCLDEFTCENGATYMLPATQHIAPFPTTAFTQKHERQVAAPAGTFVILDAMMFHRAGINRSGQLRRAVNHVIGLPFFAQQVDLPSAIQRRQQPEPQDPLIRKYLGYRWAPAPDATEWRKRRM